MKNSRLEEIRSTLGMNKTEFASAMGVGANYYYNILKGDGASNLRLEHLENLLEKHSVNPAWILTGQGEKFLDSKNGTSGWIAGHIMPDLSSSVRVDEEILSYLVKSVIAESRMPILSSDFAHALCVRFGKYYLHENPDATSENLSVPALTAGFLALLHTVQSLTNEVFQLDREGRVSIQFGAQHYSFFHHGSTEK